MFDWVSTIQRLLGCIKQQKLESIMQVIIRCFVLLCTFVCGLSYAQTSGEITYKQTTQLKELLKDQPAAIQALVPNEKISWLTVKFIKDKYLIETKLDDQPPEEVTVRLSASAVDSRQVVDLVEKTKIQFGTASGVKYQVLEDMVELQDLKLTGDSKDILGYLTKKVVVNFPGNQEQKTTIWYTELIPNNIAPIAISGIPGAILSMQIGENYYEATEVKFFDIDPIAIEVPEGYRKITAEQHADLVEEDIESIGGNNRTIIRR